MKFIHITKTDNIGSHRLQSEYFRAAAEARGLEYIRLIDTEIGPLEYIALEASSEDVVYRSSLSLVARKIEKKLMTFSPRSIYYDMRTVFCGKGSSRELMERIGLPVVPGIPLLPRKKRDALAVAEKLGGFPLVIKVMGGMEGVGVLRLDSIESFNSVSDFVRQDPKASATVMKYFPHEYYARLVVVGDTVVAATREGAPLGDFRANARGPRDEQGHSFTPDEAESQAAIAAVKELGVLTAGVDVMYGENGEFFLTEANCPYNMAETQTITGIDIAGHIIDAMMEKSQ